MKLIVGVLFFVTAFALSNAVSVTTVKRIANDQLLLNSLMENRANNYAAPCFGLYLPIFDDILNEFSASYQLCGTEAQSAIDVLGDEAAANRTLLTSTAQDICTSMTDCSAESDSLDFFDCYSSVGGNNVKTMYNLSSNAGEIAAALRQQYVIIEADMEKCQNASERVYVESTSSATEALNYCLANGPPEIVTTTTEQSVSTTEAPETTVVEDTTTEAPLASEASDALFEEEDLSRSVNTVPKISPKLVLRGKRGLRKN